MHKQLIRVYLLVFLTVCLLLYTFGAIVDTFFDSDDNYQLSVPQLFELHHQSEPELTVYQLPLNAVQFPPDIERRLNSGKVVALDLANNDVIYYKKVDDSLLTIGPLPNELAGIERNSQYLNLLFYIVLAIAFLLVFLPIAKDMIKVQNAAKQFAKKPQPLTINVKSTSSIYPIAATLTDMSHRITNLMKRQKDLSNTIAHEIRTPLARMRFTLRLIAPEIEEKYYQRFDSDIDEINTLVCDYLELARIEDKNIADNIKFLPTSELLNPLIDKFEVYQHQCNISISGDSSYCYYDPDFMVVAAQNLIVNALRYAKHEIRVTLKVSKESCSLAVADDGDGLADKKQVMKQAFTRHAQSQSDFGFGLGLYITNQIAIQHKGQLHISEDEQLGGAKFDIIWPNLNLDE